MTMNSSEVVGPLCDCGHPETRHRTWLSGAVTCDDGGCCCDRFVAADRQARLDDLAEKLGRAEDAWRERRDFIASLTTSDLDDRMKLLNAKRDELAARRNYVAALETLMREILR